jgi:hypothetical protein
MGAVLGGGVMDMCGLVCPLDPTRDGRPELEAFGQWRILTASQLNRPVVSGFNCPQKSTSLEYSTPHIPGTPSSLPLSAV